MSGASETESGTRLVRVVAAAELGLGEADGARAALVAWSGERAAVCTAEFLLAHLRNPNTRRAYTRAVQRFVAWCAARELSMPALRGPHVAAYIDELGRELAPLSVKQHLAALRHWLDALVVGHVLEANPAHAVRGPRYAQSAGKTPVLEREEARALLDSIAGDGIVARRDKALIAVMLFSFARIGAVVGMKVRDYRAAGTARAAFHLHEKGGRFHVVPAHHRAAELVDAYLEASGLSGAPGAPLWQGAPGRSGRLSGEAMTERAALGIVKRRCKSAKLPADICNHSFRATGITLHQDAGGDLEAARQLAGHASVKTTQLYNRSMERTRRAEVERVQL
jgi:site-specific recombinase XerD